MLNGGRRDNPFGAHVLGALQIVNIDEDTGSEWVATSNGWSVMLRRLGQERRWCSTIRKPTRPQCFARPWIQEENSTTSPGKDFLKTRSTQQRHCKLRQFFFL